MSKITAIGTAVPEYKHNQHDIQQFMETVYALPEAERRKLKFLYRQSGIGTRYSVIPDYSLPAGSWEFYSPTENLEPFPSIEKRLQCYRQHAAPLSLRAIQNCMAGQSTKNITHLITVSCTGMSAPGLDLELLELLELPPTTFRTSVNFMGCYAAVHALKMADAFCKADPDARVMVVCTELCTLHFQKEASIDNITSSMLFADGAAAALVSGQPGAKGLTIKNFYSKVATEGKKDMAWEIASGGFLMTLSSYIPGMIAADFNGLVTEAVAAAGMTKEDITKWCIHPGGKKILEAVHNSLGFTNGQLQPCYDVLQHYGNMSSATLLFVLKDLMEALPASEDRSNIFAAAFGPGLTMETLILSA